MSLLICSYYTFSSFCDSYARSMLVGKAAILFVSKRIVNVSCRKSYCLFSWRIFCFDTYDHLSVVMTEEKETYLWCPSVLTALHTCTGYESIAVSSLFGVFFVSPACSDHSSCDNQGTWGCITCWNLKWWMRICGSTLGCYYYLCQGGYAFCLCYFMVILDHIQWGINFSESIGWMRCLPR